MTTGSGFSMLLVEDEAVALKLLAGVLARKFPGVALYSSGNGRTGLQLFLEQAPDIVITDINMPEMTGVQMARQIRPINPGSKIITLSADQEPEQGAGSGSLIDHVIFKPINFPRLFAAIEACMADIAQQRI